MTADDVIYSFKRLADPQNRSPGWWVLDGKILGLNAWREAASKAGTTDYSAPVEGLTALDKYTLQLKLPQASYQLIYSLQMTFTSIVPREAVEQYGKEFINHAVGTGPWKLSEFNGSAKAVFVKNPTYREELYPSEGEAGDAEKGLLADSGKRLPLADKLVYTIFVEDQPMWLNFMKGTLDTTTIPKDNYAQAVGPDGQMTPDMKAQNIVLHVTPLLDVTHESFNMDDPLVGKNKYLRQALSLAINDKPFIETFYNGRAIPAQGPIPPGLAGYDEKLKNPYRQFNLEKAKQLLAKAGFPEGKGLPTLEYITYSSSTNRQLNEYIEREWATLGVKVKFTTYSWPEFQASIKNRKGQIWSFAWGGDYPDAENFLQLFYSKNGSPGPNDANFKNAEFDRLYEKALALPDSPARTALYQQMQAIVIEESPWIPMVHRLGYNATRSWLKNFKRLDEQHNPAKYYRVEAPAKN
jgi:ABC-type transport system substrate-binding protein